MISNKPTTPTRQSLLLRGGLDARGEPAQSQAGQIDVHAPCELTFGISERASRTFIFFNGKLRGQLKHDQTTVVLKPESKKWKMENG